MRQIQYTLFLIIFFLLSQNTQAQNFKLSIGTDIPYQHYLGATLELNRIDIAYRTGILVPPYSDIILDIAESLGTPELYINLLDASYDFGWMNSLGAYYKFGKQKNWYLGPEFRLDLLTAADSRTDLVEAVIGQSISRNPLNRASVIQLGLTTYAFGLRFGRAFTFGKDNKHQINAEFSISKHIASQTSLSLNNQDVSNINQLLDDLFWEEVFKPYGYLGGVGVAYAYRF